MIEGFMNLKSRPHEHPFGWPWYDSQFVVVLIGYVTASWIVNSFTEAKRLVIAETCPDLFDRTENGFTRCETQRRNFRKSPDCDLIRRVFLAFQYPKLVSS